MKDIKIEDISDEKNRENYFHVIFTNEDNIDELEQNVEEKGLTPRIGNRSKGCEQTAKVFFSSGKDGIIGLMGTALRNIKGAVDYHYSTEKEKEEKKAEKFKIYLEYEEKQDETIKTDKDKRNEKIKEIENDIDSEFEMIENWYNNDLKKLDTKEFSDKDINEKNWKKSYSIFEKFLKKSRYYKLSLNGIKKDKYEKIKNRKRTRKKYDFLYDDLNEASGQIMSKQNMHTISGKGVSSKKIKRVTADGRDDAFSVVNYVVDEKLKNMSDEELNKNENYKIRYLRNFFDFVEKEKSKNSSEKNRKSWELTENGKREANKKLQELSKNEKNKENINSKELENKQVEKKSNDNLER